MERVYSSLAERADSVHKSVQDGKKPRRAVIALTGPPGSGKTTIAGQVIQRLNSRAPEPYAAVLPMDGFHIPRSTLDTLPNREEAYAKRGSAWTFDASGVLKLVQTLHKSKEDSSEVIYAPSFDHKQKDPVDNGITITPDISLVILEGNWLLLDEEPWSKISGFVDDTWFVDVDSTLARDRIARRHLEAGIENTMEAAIKRAEGNDLVNGDLVRTRLVKPAVKVQSVEIDMAELSGEAQQTTVPMEIKSHE